MTNPIVVSASENHFNPLLIHNNGSGYDTEILRKFGEPAWNYQVVRFLDQNEKDIIPRKDKVWTTLPLLQRMKKTLVTSKRPVPHYLDLAISELDTSSHKTIAISQHCFWTGEARLGQIEGVIATEAGWFDGKEVTKLTYDSRALTIEQLLRESKKLRCADNAYISNPADLKKAKTLNLLPAKTLTSSYRPARQSDQKRQVQAFNFPNSVSQGQLTKFNAFYHVDKNIAASYLTEKQLKHMSASR